MIKKPAESPPPVAPIIYVYPDDSSLGPVFGREFRRLPLSSDTPALTWRIISPSQRLKATPSPTAHLIFGSALHPLPSLPSDTPAWLVHPPGYPAHGLTLPPQSHIILPGLDSPGRLSAWRRKAREFQAHITLQSGIARDTRTTWPDVLTNLLHQHPPQGLPPN